MSEATTVHFNVNNVVRVRLTKAGKVRHLTNLAERQAQLAEHGIATTDLHPADADGWREWQLWELMRDFGEDMFNGCDVPFVGNVIEIRVPTDGVSRG